jgi:hypothetical protein
VQADILGGGPDNRQATVLGREDVNLIGALHDVAEEAFASRLRSARQVPRASRPPIPREWLHERVSADADEMPAGRASVVETVPALSHCVRYGTLFVTRNRHTFLLLVEVN